MADAPQPMTDLLIAADLLSLCNSAVEAVEAVFASAKAGVGARVTRDDKGRVSGASLETEQHAAHSLAWLATYVESLRQMRDWAKRLDEAGTLGETEQLLLQCAFGEYLAQISGGIPMAQGEYARLSDMGVSAEAGRELETAPVKGLIAAGASSYLREKIADVLTSAEGFATFGTCGLDED